MTPAQELYLRLVRAGLHPAEPVEGYSEVQSDDIWREVFTLAVRQGTAALAHSGMLRLPEEFRPDRALRIEWAMHCERLAERHHRQARTAAEVAEILARNGIRMTILKGLGMSTLYPTPTLRECGDIDLWLGSGFGAGNDLLRKAGAAELCDMHKHTVFRLHGVRVENHRTLLNVHRNRAERELNELLRRIAEAEASGDESIEVDARDSTQPRETATTPASRKQSRELTTTPASGQQSRELTTTPASGKQSRELTATPASGKQAQPLWQSPSPTFEAIFVMRHSANHFLDDGISFHHLCDWACLLEKRWSQVDHTLFARTMAAYGMQEFAALMTAAAILHLGAPGEMPPHDPAVLQRFLGDLFAYNPAPAPTGRLEWLLTRLHAPWSIRWRFRLLHIPLNRYYRQKFIEKWHDWFLPRE